MTTLQFVDTHNLVAVLAKPTESDGFEQIVDNLNAHTIKYALTVNPTIYTSCIEQFWTTIKVKTINGEVQLQALVDGKKIIVTEASIRRDLQLDDEEGMDCLPNATIFEELTRMFAKTTAWNEFSSTMASAIICLATNQKFNFSKYIFKSMVKNLDNAAQKEIGEGSAKPADPHHTPIITQPSSSQPQRKQKSRRPKRKDTEIPQYSVPSNPTNVVDEAINEEPISTTDLVTTASEVVTTANVEVSYASPTAATITNVELTLAQTLAELKSARPKTKGVVMQEPSESTPTISLKLSSHAKGQGSMDKGKAKMIEPEKPLKKKDHIKFDEEEALRLQAAFDEEDRLAREIAQQVKVANIAWDDIQAKIDADYQLAERLRKFFIAKRAEEKKNRPPTRAQQRSIMCTYLKNMAGWKPKDLKNKSFANIQELLDKAKTRVNTFVDMDTELVKGSEIRAEGSKTREESSSKRAGDELEQEKAKKKKVDDDQEATKMKELIKIVPDEEEVAVDAITLANKPPSIVDYKIIKEGKISNYQIIRADGSSKRYSAFIRMLRSFYREDLETLWKLVKAKHGYTRPEEGYERVL
ncbi:hypothetical protein Tco_1403827 [Tanacetum coccineum]